MIHLGLLVGISALVFFFWQHSILLPLKLLVVFFHEASHALAALVTGGSVREFVVSPNESGHVMSLGGNQFLIISAGYLGSLVWGAIIYLAALNTHLDRWVMAALGVVIAVITWLFGSNSFVLVYGMCVSLAMLFAGRYLTHNVNDFFLRLIGLTSMLYVPYDIYSDTIVQASQLSDASMLAENFGGTTRFWGLSWIGVSSAIIVVCLVVTVRQAHQHWRSKTPNAESA